MTVLVSWIAIVIALATFLATQVEVRRRAKLDYVARLEKRVDECDRDRLELHKQLDALRDENVLLMRKLVKLQNGAS